MDIMPFCILVLVLLIVAMFFFFRNKPMAEGEGRDDFEDFDEAGGDGEDFDDELAARGEGSAEDGQDFDDGLSALPTDPASTANPRRVQAPEAPRDE